MRRRLSMLAAGLITAAAALGAGERAAHAWTPTAVTFDINAGFCTWSYAELYVNGHFAGTGIVHTTLTDPAVLALLDPNGCNTFGFAIVDDCTGASPVSWVKVTVDTDVGPKPVCIFDGYVGNPDGICQWNNPAQTWTGVGSYVAGDDNDGDGLIAGVGDACEDNCGAAYNPSQTDSDGDGAGDACDNCPAYNPSQADTDRDGHADACDNCPTTFNHQQRDVNHNGTGDLCDPACGPDPDGDGYGNLCDNCPSTYNPSQVDSDNDGAGDACAVTCVSNMPATADSYVVPDHPNFGTANPLMVSAASVNRQRNVLLRFNTSAAGVPYEARVVSGQIDLYQTLSVGGQQTITLHDGAPSLDGWYSTYFDEYAVTWTSAPQPGAVYGQGVNRASGSGPVSIPITAHPDAWQFDGSVILTQASGLTGVASREDANPARRPRLSICYDLPEYHY